MPAAVDGLALPVEGDHEAAHDVVGHVVVDVVGQLDEAERLAEVSLHPPRQVARVDGQAVAADAGTGREAHVAEGLGGGGVDGLPDVDAEVGGEHGQLVDEGDVDVAEGVLQQLGELGLLGRGDRDGALDDRVVERLHRGQRGGVDAGDHLGRVDQGPGGIARVDALGAVAEVEVLARHQARALLEERPHQLLGGAGVRRRLQDDRRARAQVAGNRSCRGPRCRTGRGCRRAAASAPRSRRRRSPRRPWPRRSGGSGRWRGQPPASRRRCPRRRTRRRAGA